MMATKKKSFNAELDDLLEGLDLPTDEDIRQDTHNAKVSHAKKVYYQTVAGQRHKERISQITNSPENIAKRVEQMREERGVPCKFISPTGQEFSFRCASEANEHFGKNVAIHIPATGAKRVQRREFKNWIVVRDDGSSSEGEIDRLKDEVKLKLHPLKKERDIKAWSEKMEAWRNSKEGKAQKKNKKEVAKTMGKKNSQRIMTPDGEFDSLTLAAEFYGIGKASMSQRLRDHPSKYWKVL